MHVMLDANELGLSHLGMDQRVLTALMGYAVVFAGLLILMAIVYIMGMFFKKKKKRALAARPAGAKPAPMPAAPEPEPEKAPGSAGEVKRFDVPDKEAALIMAIVADQMGKPLNELRFKAIKEVKEDEV